MTRAERDEDWATRNERRAATKDNAKRKKRKGKLGRKGGGTKKVAPGRKRAKTGLRPTKAMAQMMAAEKDMLRALTAAAKVGRDEAIAVFVDHVRQLMDVRMVATDPDRFGWLCWIERFATVAYEHLDREVSES